MADFQPAVEKVLQSEGGYSDRAADRGGPTNFGITEKTARSFGFQGDMRDFTLEQAIDLYKREYWDPLNLDKAAQGEAEQMFQMAVNSGTGFARQARDESTAIDPNRARLGIAQIRHYAEIVNKAPGQVANLHGWINRALEYV
jgi:Glycosyl hydrolase 108